MAKRDCSVETEASKEEVVKPDDIQWVTYGTTVNPVLVHS